MADKGEGKVIFNTEGNASKEEGQIERKETKRMVQDTQKRKIERSPRCSLSYKQAAPQLSPQSQLLLRAYFSDKPDSRSTAICISLPWSEGWLSLQDKMITLKRTGAVQRTPLYTPSPCDHKTHQLLLTGFTLCSELTSVTLSLLVNTSWAIHCHDWLKGMRVWINVQFGAKPRLCCIS